MKKRIIIFALLWSIILIGHSIGNLPECFAQAKDQPEPSSSQPASPSKPQVKLMGVDEIKIGMTGYGKTVFQGTKIEKFDVSVMGVLKNGGGPKYDMILIKCSHPVVDKAGVIAGMSGSPIYIVTDKEKEPAGRLIGALGYGWSFTNESIAGVTPIELMLTDLNKPIEKSTGSLDNNNQGEKLASLSATNGGSAYGGPPNTKMIEAPGEMKPLMTPLFVSGVSSYRLRYLAQALEKYNLMPVQSGSTTAELKETVSKELEPGSAVGVTLVRGDEEWTGVGTVTYRDGDKISAFGHRMEMYGEEVDAPMTNAFIYGTMSSINRSFKFGSAVSEVGVLQQDRRSSISGVLKKKAKMMPLKIIVENVKTGRKETFNYEVIHHRNLMPDLLTNLMMSAADAVEVMPFEPALIEVTTTLKIKDNEPVVFKRLVSDSTSGAGCGAVNNIFNPIWNNPYTKIDVENVTFDLRITNENRALQLLNAWTETKEILPGQTIRIYCQLKPYLKEPFIKTIDFTVPQDLKAPQTLTITVMSSNNLMPPLPSPTNVPELINYLKSFYDGGNLVAVMSLPNIDLKFNGNNYKNLPRSFLSGLINQWPGTAYGAPGYDTFRRSPTFEKPLELGQDYILAIEPMQHIVYGSRSVAVNLVKYKNK